MASFREKLKLETSHSGSRQMSRDTRSQLPGRARGRSVQRRDKGWYAVMVPLNRGSRHLAFVYSSGARKVFSFCYY